jgi:peptidyl-tRNA hydrolase
MTKKGRKKIVVKCNKCVTILTTYERKKLAQLCRKCAQIRNSKQRFTLAPPEYYKKIKNKNDWRFY